MKKQLSLIHSIILSILFISPLNAEQLLEDSYGNVQKRTIFYAETLQEATILEAELLKTVQYLNTCLSYWKHQKYHPLSYFFTKNPTKWFVGKKQPDELNDHIAFVQQDFKKQTEYLGRLDLLQQKLNPEQNNSKKEQLITELYQLISEITQSLSGNNQSIPVHIYAKAHERTLGTHALPSHFIRNWIEYSGLTLAGLGALYCWYKYGADIKTWAVQTKESAAIYAKENIQEPLKNMRDIFYNKTPHKEFISEDMMENNQDMLKQMIEKYYENKYHSLTSHFWQNMPVPSKEEIACIADKAVKNRVLPKEIMDDYAAQTPSLTRNLFSPNGTIGSLFLMQLHNAVNVGCDVIKETDKIVKTQRLNMQILITIPTILIAGVGSYLGYKIYKHYSEKTMHTIKQALCEIEIVLHRSEELSPQEHGCIIYWNNVIRQSLYNIYGEKALKLHDYCDKITKTDISKQERVILTQQLLRFL